MVVAGYVHVLIVVLLLNPFSTAVLFWGHTSPIPSGLSPKRDCGPNRVELDTI